MERGINGGLNMALPLIPVLIVAGRVALAVVRPAARIAVRSAIVSVKVVPVVTRPVVQFTRAAITGNARQIALDKYGTSIINIGVATRAGMQTNRLAGLAAYSAAMRLPRFLLRTAIRDGIVTPLYSPVYQAYAIARGGRALRGATSVVERAADKVILLPARKLQPFGLAPTLRGDLMSAGRIYLYAQAADQIAGLRTRAEKLDVYGKWMMQRTAELQLRARTIIDTHLPPAATTPTIVPPVEPASITPAVVVPTPSIPAQKIPPRIHIVPQVNRPRRRN